MGVGVGETGVGVGIGTGVTGTGTGVTVGATTGTGTGIGTGITTGTGTGATVQTPDVSIFETVPKPVNLNIADDTPPPVLGSLTPEYESKPL